MAKMKYTGICLAAFFFVVGLGAQPQMAYYKDIPASKSSSFLSKEALRGDIIFWNKVMEESHVDLFHFINRETLMQLEETLLAPLPDSVSYATAVLIIGRLGAALNEGHIGLPSSGVVDSLYLQSRRFPFLLQKAEDDALIVSEDISTEQKLSPAARIIRINGRPVSQLVAAYKHFFGGLATWRGQQVAANIRKLLFLDGIKAPFAIDAVTASGENISFNVAGFDKQQGDSINKAFSQRSRSSVPYAFKVLENNTGYLNYRSMVDDAADPFAGFLERMFTSIDSQKINGLVIDLRENGGGNSMFGEWLTSYFSKQPYRFSAGMKWKISEHYKEFLKSKPGGYNESDDRFYRSQKNGDIYTSLVSKLAIPKKRDHFFSGKVAVLMGPNTFSSANMLSDGIKTYGMARIFGEASGETPNDFGEMFNFMLPNSGIIARGSTKMFTRADGNEKNFDPVLPDVWVKPTAADIIQKKDPVLQAAMNWIRE
jgi:C-terminal processing protease CtpA/Prc